MKKCNRNAFIFVSQEGTTQPPIQEDSSQEMDNLQVIGFAIGKDAEDSFQNLIEDNKSLLETGFNEVIAYELAPNYSENQKYFFLDNIRR